MGDHAAGSAARINFARLRRGGGLLWPSVARLQQIGPFFQKPDAPPDFGLTSRRRSPVFDFRGMAMSELIVLVSCGAAFVTGLVIAGMSLIG
jgi:hypothetical protein